MDSCRVSDEEVLNHLPLVRFLAARRVSRGVEFEDLVQQGTIGLVRAIKGFDVSRGTKFSTYAAWWIRRSMEDAERNAAAIRRPRSAPYWAVERAITVVDHCTELPSLDECPASLSVEDDAISFVARDEVRAVVGRLPLDEHRCVVLRFGLDGRTPLGRDATARVMRMRYSRVVLLERAALQHLREELGPDRDS